MLTDAAAKAARPKERPYRLTDTGGLHLFVTPAGGRHWRLRYEVAGREKLLSIGPYPAVSLAEAREVRAAAKATLRAGRDPALEKRTRRLGTAALNGAPSGDTYETMAREWHQRQAPAWTEHHAADVLDSLERDVFPTLGLVPVRDITPPMVLNVLRLIEARPAIETAHRVRQRMSAVFVYAIASGRAEADPAAIVKGAMARVIKGRQPAITELPAAREVLARVEAIPAHPMTKLANRLLALTVVRPGELRAARWDEFDSLDGPEPLWRVPAERMKMRREHLVPLSRQAAEVLLVARGISGRGPLVFPSSRHAHRPMSENAIGYLLNRAGYHGHHVPHGWRATFSTVMNERYPADRQVIDLMLAHVQGDRTEAAYNRSLHLMRRRELAQIWADTILAEALAADNLCLGVRR